MVLEIRSVPVRGPDPIGNGHQQRLRRLRQPRRQENRFVRQFELHPAARTRGMPSGSVSNDMRARIPVRPRRRLPATPGDQAACAGGRFIRPGRCVRAYRGRPGGSPFGVRPFFESGHVWAGPVALVSACQSNRRGASAHDIGESDPEPHSCRHRARARPLCAGLLPMPLSRPSAPAMRCW